jgi:hypothetical protein
MSTTYNGFPTLAEALDAHKAWLGGAKNGTRLVLRYADISDADLRYANLRGAILGDGLTWERYLSELVPALLTAGGKTLEAVVTESWSCHHWKNCPMATAFGVHSLREIPPLYQAEAERFVQFFDAGFIPNPLTGEKVTVG